MFTALLSLMGVVILSVLVIVVAIKGKSDRVVSWAGLGVTFEIRPCDSCHRKPHRANQHHH